MGPLWPSHPSRSRSRWTGLRPLTGRSSPIRNVYSFFWSCLCLSSSPIMDLKIISININGLNYHLKRTALVDWLRCMKADVVCLQETHSPSHESARKWFANSGYRVASSSLTSKSAGVAILVKDSYKITKIIKD